MEQTKRFSAYESMDAQEPRVDFDTEVEAISYALKPEGNWVMKIVDTQTKQVIYSYDPTDTGK